MVCVISKSRIPYLIRELQKEFTVYAPVRRHNLYDFDKIVNPDDIELNYNTTLMSPKKFLFPSHEVLFGFRENSINEPNITDKMAIFGIHIYDAKAIQILDEIFTKNFVDIYYQQKRKNSMIIAIDNTAPLNGFYDELEIGFPGVYDILLRDIGDGYIAKSGSDSGKRLMKLKFFEDSDIRETEVKSKAKLMDLKKIAQNIEKGPEQKIWKEIADRCFGCGICTYVCPICHCFDVHDKVNLDKISGYRYRCWDSCMLYNFALVADGHNFREHLYQRIHNWYHHKFVRAVRERGKVDCVGCGRCITFCPAGIDIHGVLKKLEMM